MLELHYGPQFILPGYVIRTVTVNTSYIVLDCTQRNSSHYLVALANMRSVALLTELARLRATPFIN